MGLRGLEPLTSSLSGKRSNRLSYRPVRHLPLARTLKSRVTGARRMTLPHPCRPLQNGPRCTADLRGDAGLQSSVRVICRPPTRLEQTLYRNAPSVEIAVTKMTSITAMTIVSDTTRPSPM